MAETRGDYESLELALAKLIRIISTSMRPRAALSAMAPPEPASAEKARGLSRIYVAIVFNRKIEESRENDFFPLAQNLHDFVSYSKF